MIGALLRISLFVCVGIAAFNYYNEDQRWKMEVKTRYIQDKQLKDRELSKKRAQVEKGEAYRSVVGQKQEELRLLRQEWEQLVTKLPDRGPKMPEVIRALAREGEKSALKLIQVRPMAGRKDRFINISPIQIVLKGTYVQIMSFLDSVSSLERIIKPVKLELDQPVTRGSNRIISAKLEVITYYVMPGVVPNSPSNPNNQGGG